MERFPLAGWIERHLTCRYDLASSGMRGAIPPPPWPRRRPPVEVVDVLRTELSEHVGVDPERLFLSHGASEANGWVLGYLARTRAGRRPTATCRVRYPEYPPLFDAARAHGLAVTRDPGPADVAIVSRPRNPEGDLWPEERLAAFGEGARHLLVDETFREFAGARSIAVAGSPRRWTTGSFTKFYGADEVRVGFAIAPPEAAERFGRYVGLVSDELAPGPAAIALQLLRDARKVRAAVRRVLDRNLTAFRAGLPGALPPAGPVFFDRSVRGGGRRLAERCLATSVLVCPGDYFGSPDGVRIALTRRNFPQGLRCYLRVRAGGRGMAQRSVRSGRSTAPRFDRPNER